MMKLFSRAMEATFYIVVMVTVAIGIAWWSEGDPQPTLSRNVLTPEVRAGDDLVIRIAAVMDRACEVGIQRSIIDSEGTLHTAVAMRAEREKGSETVLIRSTVPSAAAPGQAYYRVILEWRCNPLQQIWPRVVQLPDLAFTIIKA